MYLGLARSGRTKLKSPPLEGFLVWQAQKKELPSSKGAKLRRQPKAAPTGWGIWPSQITNQSLEIDQATLEVTLVFEPLSRASGELIGEVQSVPLILYLVNLCENATSELYF